MRALLYFIATLAFITYGSGANADPNCNPKAQVHQERLRSLMDDNREGRDVSFADQTFAVCMLPEKEDRDAFIQRANANRGRNAQVRAARYQQQIQEQRQYEAAARLRSLCDPPTRVPCGNVCMDTTGSHYNRCIDGKVTY